MFRQASHSLKEALLGLSPLEPEGEQLRNHQTAATTDTPPSSISTLFSMDIARNPAPQMRRRRILTSKVSSSISFQTIFHCTERPSTTTFPP